MGRLRPGGLAADRARPPVGRQRPPVTSFSYQQAELTCDGVPLQSIAEATGTPVYVYSAAAIASAYRALDRAWASHPHALHYALKANSTLAIARLLRSLGSGVDANSGGEIEVALRAGFIPRDIVFTGVGKTREELERAAALGVRAINVESPGELGRLDEIGRALGTRVRVALRVNPDVDARSHPKISTGRRFDKFGIPIEFARPLFREAARRTGLEPAGIHVHIGSQIVDLAPLVRAAEAVVALSRDLDEDGILIEHLDLGGGLGISYDGGAVPTPDDYGSALLPVLRGSRLRILLEPGRVIAGPAGVLLARVVDIKEYEGGTRFVVLDAGMTELLRPALYGAFHRIDPVVGRAGEDVVGEIVGPLCETSDTFGKDRVMPPLEVGDLVAIRDAGAYGMVMASTYNRRLLPPEVLVEDGRWRVIRRRQTIEDLVALEE